MILRNLVKVVAGALALGFLIAAAPSQAAQPALDFTGYNHQFVDTNYNIGWRFTVGPNDVTVSQLGYFDLNQDGLATAHDVALWSSTGSEIVAATVPSGTAGTLNGKFRYATIADTILMANHTYVIGATSGTLDEFALGSATIFPTSLTGLTVDSNITLVQSALDDGTHSGLAYANLTSPFNTLFAGPNMIYVAGLGNVPEPGTVGLLLASGFSGAGVFLRNRKLRK